MAAIILSEEQCQEQLKNNNKTCDASLQVLVQKGRALEAQLAQEKEACGRDKAAGAQGQRTAEAQVLECVRVREQLRAEQQRAREQLAQVQALCAPLEREPLAGQLRTLWADALRPRALDSLVLGGFHPLAGDAGALRRLCEQVPDTLLAKADELARGLRGGIERVARENAELRRLRAEAEAALAAAREAAERAAREAREREAQVRGECAQQTRLALEEKAALRRERDALERELGERRRELEQARVQVAVSGSALDTCIKTKTQMIPGLPMRPMSPVANPPPIDQASLEEFKRRVLESQKPPGSNGLAPASG
ncbi:plasmalemma vesicle-associated protein [Erinaceus europaeus]|uniref:Plasmalemma vesicle-associated protein n=1 Tax=Erinaceus europaeus TaxID=9365 RepID=A0ABM3WP84_ERIEU|nr:plasmalemma vesicle-associated protein [Erinaceus europaeus]